MNEPWANAPNWLIDKIVDKEAERIAMREQFLKYNQERLN